MDAEMAWVRFDDSFPNHPKVKPLSNGAYRLWTSMIAYSNRYGMDGYITMAQIDDECSHIRRRRKLVEELKAAPLLHELGINWDGSPHELDKKSATTRQQPGNNQATTRYKPSMNFWVHDIGEYQPTAAKSPELSQKRSEAGKKGAAARWGTGGNLPLAKNAPVPSRPDPTRPDPSRMDRSIDPINLLSSISELLDAGRKRFGELPFLAIEIDALNAILPITSAELQVAADSKAKGWVYARKVIETYRRGGSGKPKEPPCQGDIMAAALEDSLAEFSRQLDGEEPESKEEINDADIPI